MIEPPGNIVRYTPNAFASRKRSFPVGRSYKEWVRFFQYREFEIRGLFHGGRLRLWWEYVTHHTVGFQV